MIVAPFICIFLFLFEYCVCYRLLFHRNSLKRCKYSAVQNFVTAIIDKEISAGKRRSGEITTRFPPEPNGHLHLGHAKSLFLNHDIAARYNGKMMLRFDDTNPEKESQEFIDSIIEDVKWLLETEIQDGTCKWDGIPRYTSSYFPKLFQAAEYLVQRGLAYVDELSPDNIREYRGTFTDAGHDSPYRDRPIDINMRLLHDMKNGHFLPEQCILRAKIDNASPFIALRDPTLYRIKHAHHPRTDSQWCMYPMYDFAQALSDAWDGVTHSLCTEEFANNRPLYDWLLTNVAPSGLLAIQSTEPSTEHDATISLPQQIEFAKLRMSSDIILSKREISRLIRESIVSGWDDPRLYTIKALRRRGIVPAALRQFFGKIGVSKAESIVPCDALDACIRDTFNQQCRRAFAVIDPLHITITNWPYETFEFMNASSHPKNHSISSLYPRKLAFGKEILIQRTDFRDVNDSMSVASSNEDSFFGLVIGGYIRLKNSYILHCDSVLRDNGGVLVSLNCSLVSDTLGGKVPTNLSKPRGTIQWLSAAHAIPALVIEESQQLTSNPISQEIPLASSECRSKDPQRNIVPIYIEESESMNKLSSGSVIQFERLGYYVKVDTSKDDVKHCLENRFLSFNLSSTTPVFRKVLPLIQRLK